MELSVSARHHHTTRILLHARRLLLVAAAAVRDVHVKLYPVSCTVEEYNSCHDVGWF